MQGAASIFPVPPQLVQRFHTASREAMANVPLQRWPRGLRPQRWLMDSLR
jgi:hypothetical protein